jgi:hypothetical protein
MKLFFTRLALASVMALLVTLACLNVSRDGAGVYIGYAQMMTERRLESTEKAIQLYRQKNGSLPQSIREVEVFAGDLPALDNIYPVDAWRRPFIYSSKDDSFTLTSFGRDGKRGGFGLDQDLTRSPLRKAERPLPYSQVLFDPLARGMLLMSLISGAMTFLLTFAMTKPRDMVKDGAISLGLRLLVTLIAAVLAGTFITMLHVPSGH